MPFEGFCFEIVPTDSDLFIQDQCHPGHALLHAGVDTYGKSFMYTLVCSWPQTQHG